jgi:tetratricopeptide (TPR) repeat protein
VRTIFVARLDRLTERIRAVVQAAAILGREFDVRVLAAMLRVDEKSRKVPAELIELVAEAEQRSIWGALAELRYLFKHALLRDAAYGMQLQAHRRSLHQSAAAALERLHAADLSAHYGEIAYHYEAACRQGLADACAPACAYLQQAGEQAAARYENAAAVDFYSRALALTPAEAEDQRLGLLLTREAVYHLLGWREAQRADLQALEELVQARQRPGERAELALRWSRLGEATGDYSRAQARAQAAVAAAQAAGAVDLEASAQLVWALVLWRQGDYPGAQAHLQTGLLLAQAAGRQDLQADAVRLLGNVAQGNYTAAQHYYEQALVLCREVGDRQGEGSALSNLGLATFAQGDYAAARQHFAQAQAIFREVGYRRGEGVTLDNLGCIASTQGDYAAARQYCEQALAISQEISSRQGEGLALNNLGDAASTQGDYVAARQYYEQALAILQEVGSRWAEGVALSNLGAVAVTQGDYAAARRYYEQALAIRRGLGQSHYIAEDLAGLAQAALAQGDSAAARGSVVEMLPILEANPVLEGAEHPRRALLTCGQVLLGLGDERGREILATAHNWLQEQADKMEAEARRRFLENVPENRELLAEFARMTAGAGTPVPTAPTGKKKRKKGGKGPAERKERKGKKKKGKEPNREKRGKEKKKKKRVEEHR